jgi:hypothetical protein
MKQLRNHILLLLASAVVVSVGVAGVFAWRFRHCGGSFPGPGTADFSAHLAGGYSVHRTSSQHVIIAPEAWNDGTPIIPTIVVECATDGRFILAKRRDAGLSDAGMNAAASAVEDFWILDTKQEEVHGPLTEGLFQRLRLSLAVAESVHLRPVHEFRGTAPPATADSSNDPFR